MGKFNTALYLLDSEDSFAVGGRFEGIQFLELGGQTQELALVFADLFDAEGVAGFHNYLLLLEAVDGVVGGLEDWFYFYFHLTYNLLTVYEEIVIVVLK